jgi:hypothetical protein
VVTTVVSGPEQTVIVVLVVSGSMVVVVTLVVIVTIEGRLTEVVGEVVKDPGETLVVAITYPAIPPDARTPANSTNAIGLTIELPRASPSYNVSSESAEGDELTASARSVILAYFRN